jgi:hypothetical membrane protein
MNLALFVPLMFLAFVATEGVVEYLLGTLFDKIAKIKPYSWALMYVSAGVGIFLAFFYNYNFAHHFAFWFFLALLAALVAKKAFTWDARGNTAGTAVISVLFIMLCVAALSTAWVAAQRLAAEAAYSSATCSARNLERL